MLICLWPVKPRGRDLNVLDLLKVPMIGLKGTTPAASMNRNASSVYVP